jgi:hypothetical protein
MLNVDGVITSLTVELAKRETATEKQQTSLDTSLAVVLRAIQLFSAAPLGLKLARLQV